MNGSRPLQVRDSKCHLLNEIISLFGFSKSIQSDDKPDFTSQVVQTVAKTLGIKEFTFSIGTHYPLGRLKK